MTAVLEAPATPAPPTPVKTRRPRRWHRAAIPFAIFLTLVIGTMVLHSLNEPDRTDPSFLAPTPVDAGTPISGSLLAQRLEDRGVRVQRITKTSEALSLAYQGGVTLFVPSPSLMHRDYLRMIWNLPANTRVVLVDPSASDLARSNAPIRPAGRRWASMAVSPGVQPCGIAGLEGVGPAAVFESRYAVDPDPLLRERSCYRGAVLQFRWVATEVIAVGSEDPFRDDRIDEYDNSALAVGLLATHQDLVWLDVHETEPGPLADPDAFPGEGVPPSLAPGDEGGSTPGPGQGDPGEGGAGDPGGPRPGDGEPGGGEAGGPQGPSFFDAFPTALWATLVGALLLGLLLALWQARRLGPPVIEPLPFSVKGSETVLGRAQLYQRAGAIMSGAQTLRRSAGPQIAQALGLPPTATAQELAAEIAARYGGDTATYLALLADDLPKKDADLVILAADLDSLLTMVSTPVSPAPQGETSG